jgi:FKBP-type peptidyl-prolyl cis-trans isomerase SlyD
MKIAKDTVARFHYKLSESGQFIESSFASGDPVAILVGKGNMIPGVEAALMDREAGDKFEVTVTPEQGYGLRRENFIQRVSKKYFRDVKYLVPGMQTVLGTSQGQRVVTVVKVGGTVIDVDMNHPMAGKTLDFDIEVVDVRAAQAEELEHGHAHGVGGAQHA